jgi:hypothetical protein
MVIDIVGDDRDRIVHLDVLHGDLAQYHTAAERSASLMPTDTDKHPLRGLLTCECC